MYFFLQYECYIIFCIALSGVCYESRPCGFGQSLGRPIVRSFSHFFWSTKKNCPVSGNLWSTKFLFGIKKNFLVDQIFFWSTKNSQRLTKNFLRLNNFFLVDQKNEKKTEQLVNQETDQNHMDG